MLFCTFLFYHNQEWLARDEKYGYLQFKYFSIILFYVLYVREVTMYGTDSKT